MRGGGTNRSRRADRATESAVKAKPLKYGKTGVRMNTPTSAVRHRTTQQPSAAVNGWAGLAGEACAVETSTVQCSTAMKVVEIKATMASSVIRVRMEDLYISTQGTKTVQKLTGALPIFCY